MNYLLLVVCSLSFVLGGCAQKSPQSKLSIEAKDWQTLVRGDEERISESREATVRELAKAGEIEAAKELSKSIPNYKRGTSWAEIGTILVAQGKKGEAAKLFPAPFELYRVSLRVEQDTIVARLVRSAMASGNYPAAREMAKGMSTPEGVKGLEKLIEIGETPPKTSGQPALIQGNRTNAVANLSANIEGLKDGESAVSSDRMTVEMLLAEMEGDVKLGKKEEARQIASEIEMGLNLMKTTLRRPVYWMKLARLQTDLGLTQDAKRSYDAGMERIQHLNPRLELLDLAYADAAYVRAKLENSKNSADMIEKRVEEISQRDPGNPFPMPIMDEYFQMDALSTLAKGAWESGNPELAAKLWDRALTLAEKNPNPRSKAIGAVEVLLSHAAVKQVPSADLRKRLDKIRTGLPDDYSKLFMRNGGTE